jgi:hypothetical protein
MAAVVAARSAERKSVTRRRDRRADAVGGACHECRAASLNDWHSPLCFGDINTAAIAMLGMRWGGRRRTIGADEITGSLGRVWRRPLFLPVAVEGHARIFTINQRVYCRK